MAPTTSPTGPGTRLLAGLDAGDVDQQVGLTWIAAQEMRLLFREPDRDRAQRRLLRWYFHCADAGVPELSRLARTIDAWRDSTTNTDQRPGFHAWLRRPTEDERSTS